MILFSQLQGHVKKINRGIEGKTIPKAKNRSSREVYKEQPAGKDEKSETRSSLSFEDRISWLKKWPVLRKDPNYSMGRQE